MAFNIQPAYEYREEIKELFTEYTKMLVEGDPAFQGYLDQQNYDEEVRNLKMKYDYPMGRLYIALDEAEPGKIKAAGFTESEKHNDSPMDTSIFMKMELK